MRTGAEGAGVNRKRGDAQVSLSFCPDESFHRERPCSTGPDFRYAEREG